MKISKAIIILAFLTLGVFPSLAQVPLDPSGLAATASPTALSVVISWTDNSDNETGFKVERKLGVGGTYATMATYGAGVTTVTNSGLLSGTEYFYRVQALNLDGYSGFSNEASATTTTPPADPSGFTAVVVPNSAKIVVSWMDNSTNEQGFRVQRKTGVGGTYTNLTGIGAGITSWTNVALQPSTEYFYRVYAYNGAGNSGYSGEAGAITDPLPAAPSGLVANPSSTALQVVLSWTDHSSDENGFRVDRKLGDGGTYSMVGIVGAGVTTLTNTGGMVGGTEYFYRVYAYNGVGNSPYSDEVSVTTATAPADPLGLAATSVTNALKMVLTWTDASTNETGFKIDRKLGSGGTYTNIVSLGAGVTIYTNTTLLLPSTEYYYRVYSFNGIGNSGFSGEAIATTEPLPMVPSDLVVNPVPTTTRMVLNWTDNSADETGFRIERKQGVGGTYVSAGTVGPGVTTYTNSTGLAGGTEYFYRVCAYNGVGNSPYSGEASATTTTTPPDPYGLLAVSVTNSLKVILTWTDTSTNETGFKIDRKVGSAGTFTNLVSLGANATTYTNTASLLPFTEYFYRVYSYNGAGNSPYSNEAGVTTEPLSVAPSGLVADPSPTALQVTLTWADNSTDETGFRIERKLGVGGTFANVGTVGPGVTSFVNNTGLVAGSEYFYRVYAYNGVGNSLFSNEGSATITTTPLEPTGLNALASSTALEVVLAWVDVSGNESGFKIERKTGVGGTYTNIATVVAGAMVYTNNTALTVNTEYFYRVYAYNGAGNSPYSGEATATTLTIPSDPSGLAVSTVVPLALDLNWMDNSGNESGFKIDRKIGVGGTYTNIATVASGVTTYRNTGLVNGTEYFYMVRAYNLAGNSGYSNEASGIATVVPSTPTDLTAFLASSTEVQLQWTDQSDNENGFKIERKTEETGAYVEIGSVGTGITVFSDTGFVGGVKSYYRVRAFNQVGDSPYSNQTTTGLPVIDGVLAGGTSHSLVLEDDGTVWSFGRNRYGQLGNGNTNDSWSPLQVLGVTGARHMASRGSHGLALKTDGTLVSWGFNSAGQLGDGTVSNRWTAVGISGDSNQFVVAGESFSGSIKEDGTLSEWGSNNYGQLGDGTTTGRRSPVIIPGFPSPVNRISMGVSHSVAALSNGTVWTWGRNSLGQLGDGSTNTVVVPTQILGISNVTRVAAGDYFTVALKSDGTIWTWGSNNNGQLGNGTQVGSLIPIQVNGVNAVDVVAGGNHVLALSPGGTIWGWGANNSGQLGDGTNTRRLNPVRLTGLELMVSIATGDSHGLGMKMDGSVWCWGANGYGQLGDGTTTNRWSPVPLSGFQVLPDSDGDGIPDAQEGGSTPYQVGVHDQNSDSDGDNQSNADEYRAGTNPSNRSSSFKVSSYLDDLGNGNWTIQWPSRVGKTYQVQYSSNLTSWSDLGSPVSGTGGMLSATDSGMNPATQRKFYRVRVLP